MERHPLRVNGYSKIMEFEIEITSNSLSGVLQCIYRHPNPQEVISNKLILKDDNFPVDCFYTNKSANMKKIYVFAKQDEMVFTLANNSHPKCCTPNVKSFAVKNARIPNISGE